MAGWVSPFSRHPPLPCHQTVGGIRDHCEEGEARYCDGDQDGEPQGVGGCDGGGGCGGGGGGDDRLIGDHGLGAV